ncbi:MAG: AzlD domain-containing protein [Burkholderiaceae bacterium]
MTDSDVGTTVTILAMTAITIVTRSLFFLSNRPWTLPGWAQRGLHYAPVAALAAVIAPESVMAQGHLITTWQDARLFAIAAGVACYVWKRDVLGTIVAGMAVYLPLHIGLGW